MEVKRYADVYGGQEIKVGHIVVVKEGVTSGNSPNTITKVTKVKHGPIANTPDTILCEDANNNYGNSCLKSEVKTPSFYERIYDIRPATGDERRQYYERKREIALSEARLSGK